MENELAELRRMVGGMAKQILELQVAEVFRRSEIRATRTLLSYVAGVLEKQKLMAFPVPLEKQVGDWILWDINEFLAELADSNPSFSSEIRRALDAMAEKGTSATLPG